MYCKEHPEPKLSLWLSVLVPILVDVSIFGVKTPCFFIWAGVFELRKTIAIKQKHGCRCMTDSVNEVMREEEVAKLDDDIVDVSEIIS